jgi:hypothetical protein
VSVIIFMFIFFNIGTSNEKNSSPGKNLFKANLANVIITVGAVPDPIVSSFIAFFTDIAHERVIGVTSVHIFQHCCLLHGMPFLTEPAVLAIFLFITYCTRPIFLAKRQPDFPPATITFPNRRFPLTTHIFHNFR